MTLRATKAHPQLSVETVADLESLDVSGLIGLDRAGVRATNQVFLYQSSSTDGLSATVRPTANSQGGLYPGRWILDDSGSSVFSWKDTVRLATTAALPANTFDPATNTLTGNVDGNIGLIDGVAPAVGDRILVKNEATGQDNGIYTVTQLGDAGSPYILTRATDFDLSAEVKPASVIPVSEGATNADTAWILTTDAPIILNTTVLTFVLFPITLDFGVLADIERTDFDNAAGVLTRVARADHEHAAPRDVIVDKHLTVEDSTLALNNNRIYGPPGIAFTPAYGVDPDGGVQAQAGYVRALINGVGYDVGEPPTLIAAMEVYFSGDNGVTARARNAIQAGDTLHRGGALGFDTVPGIDFLSLDYSAFY